MVRSTLDAVLAPALAGGYGVPAINIVNDLSMAAVLSAAEAERSPVIVQTSVKTVRAIGSKVLWSMWLSMTEEISVPAVLHLDHCPEREVISECLKLGWNSVLFDASKLPVEENLRQTKLVVAEAREYGAHVEGEIESITGVEDGIGSDEVDRIQPLEVALNFINESQVDVFAPAIGNAHGRYLVEPVLDADRVKKIYEATGIPLALHGGSGMSPAQFTELIALGCAKINISTALKEVFMKSSLEYLKKAEESNKWDPLKLFSNVQNAVAGMATEHMRLFGSSGKIQ